MNRTCSFCNGSGKTRCHGCNGTGITTRRHPDNYKGWEQIPCPQCNGKGKKTCNYCSGSGKTS